MVGITGGKEMPGNGILLICRYNLLHTLPFDSDRKRMSVIVRLPNDGPNDAPMLLTKGADSSVMSLVDEQWANTPLGQNIVYTTQQYLSQYSTFGLRTLCLARRRLGVQEYNDWLLLQREAETDIDNREQLLYESALRIEHSLELLGATGVEDRLQDGVPECIHAMRHAGLKVWVLTGDKIETAVNIAYASRLFSPGMELLQLSARTLDDCSDLLSLQLQNFEQRQHAAHNAHTGDFTGRHSRTQSNAVPQMPQPPLTQPSHTTPGHARNTSIAMPPLYLQQRDDVGALLNAANASLQQTNGVFTSETRKTHRRQESAFSVGGLATPGRAKRNPKIALVVDGRTLAFCLQADCEERFLQIVSRCTSVLCCRSTPLQKASSAL